MRAFHPGLEDLPREVAVFPLSGALLLPEGRLPLNIFEPRYLAMVEDSMATGRMFGMVQAEPGAPRDANGPGLYEVGCLGRVSSFSETDDGRYLITLSGVIRFRLAEEIDLGRGYRRVRADYAPYLRDLVTEKPQVDRAALLGALRPYFEAQKIEANWDAIEETSDAMLITTLSMVCPFEVPEKQALLEATDAAQRATMLVALMQMGAHGDSHDGRPS
jgi:Lon protease-like protein